MEGSGKELQYTHTHTHKHEEDPDTYHERRESASVWCLVGTERAQRAVPLSRLRRRRDDGGEDTRSQANTIFAKTRNNESAVCSIKGATGPSWRDARYLCSSSLLLLLFFHTPLTHHLPQLRSSQALTRTPFLRLVHLLLLLYTMSVKSTIEKCVVCQQTVYAMEKMAVRRTSMRLFALACGRAFGSSRPER